MENQKIQEAHVRNFVVTKESLNNFVEEFPASHLADLIEHFETDQLCDLIERYEGRCLSFPSIKNIWVKFRNRIIKKELDVDLSRKNRERLAELFDISVDNINKIYWRTCYRDRKKKKYYKKKAVKKNERKNENNKRKSTRIT